MITHLFNAAARKGAIFTSNAPETVLRTGSTQLTWKATYSARLDLRGRLEGRESNANVEK